MVSCGQENFRLWNVGGGFSLGPPVSFVQTKEMGGMGKNSYRKYQKWEDSMGIRMSQDIVTVKEQEYTTWQKDYSSQGQVLILGKPM